MRVRVEIARPGTSEVGLHDSPNPDGGHLRVSPTAFGAFLTTIRNADT